MNGTRQLAERLRRARERAGLTPEQLDDLAGLPRGSAATYELARRILTVSDLEDLARALNVPMAELLEGIGGFDE